MSRTRIHLTIFVLFILPATSLFAQSAVSIEPIDVIAVTDSTGKAVPVITSLDIDPSGNLLAAGGDNHCVRMWDINAKNSPGMDRNNSHFQFVTNTKTAVQQTNLAMSENNHRIRFGNENVETNHIEIREQLDWVRGIVFSDDQKHLVIVGQDGQIEIHNVQTGDLVRKITGKNRGMQAVAFRPGGQEFAVCGFSTSVPVYNVATGKIVRELKAHGTSNRAIRFSPDGTYLAVAGRTGVIRVWNADTGIVEYELSGDDRRVNALAFSSGSSRLAVGGEGPNITIWSMKNGKRVITLPERTGKTYSLEFCGENLLASGESDNTIRFWNLDTRTTTANTASPNGHSGTIATLVFDAKKNVLASGSFDTTVRFWPVPQ